MGTNPNREIKHKLNVPLHPYARSQEERDNLERRSYQSQRLPHRGVEIVGAPKSRASTDRFPGASGTSDFRGLVAAAATPGLIAARIAGA